MINPLKILGFIFNIAVVITAAIVDFIRGKKDV